LQQFPNRLVVGLIPSSPAPRAQLALSEGLSEPVDEVFVVPSLKSELLLCQVGRRVVASSELLQIDLSMALVPQPVDDPVPAADGYRQSVVVRCLDHLVDQQGISHRAHETKLSSNHSEVILEFQLLIPSLDCLPNASLECRL